MRILRWVVAGLVVAGLVAFAGATLFRTQIAQHLFARAVQENLSRPLATGQPDGIHVFICGSGTPMPDPMRSGPASPSSRAANIWSSTQVPAASAH